MLPSDKELIAGLHNSNESIYETIFRTYYERLCNYANSMVNDMDEAEEIVQNTFLIIWEKREITEIHTSLKSYLYQSVHNHCLNRIKHFKIRKEYSQHYQNNTDINVESTSDTVIGNELDIQIRNAIELLPKQCKAVFKLSRFENLTYAEIAEQMGLSAKTVDNHMVRALKFLREKLKDYIPYLLWFIIFKS